MSENVLTIDGEGTGPIEAFVTALGETLNEPVTILSYQKSVLAPAAMPKQSALSLLKTKRRASAVMAWSKSQHDNNRSPQSFQP